MKQPLEWRNQWEHSIGNRNITLKEALARSLGNKLTAAILKVLISWPKGTQWVNENSHAICAMGKECAPQDLFALLDFDPTSRQIGELTQADFQEVAREVITRFEQGTKSIAEVLALRSEGPKQTDSQSSGEDRSTPQAPEPDNDKPELSEKGQEALKRLIDILGENQREYLSKFSERDLFNWAFPESVLRTRQIWQSHIATVTRSLTETIKAVDAQRLAALNVHDIATWKTSVVGAEKFCFRAYAEGLFFDVSITNAVFLPPENRDRFLDIEEAIRRYSREHGHLVNAPEPIPSEAEVDLNGWKIRPFLRDFAGRKTSKHLDYFLAFLIWPR
jgi:hypothetical protein